MNINIDKDKQKQITNWSDRFDIDFTNRNHGDFIGYMTLYHPNRLKKFFQQELERICEEVENIEVPFKQDKQTILDGKTYNDIQLMRNTYKQALNDIINIIKK